MREQLAEEMRSESRFHLSSSSRYETSIEVCLDLGKSGGGLGLQYGTVTFTVLGDNRFQFRHRMQTEHTRDPKIQCYRIWIVAQ